jgi:copper chaperone CopZ
MKGNNSSELKTNGMAIKTFIVEGMMCNNCKAHVEKSVKEITGVEDVLVDLTNGQVRVSGAEVDNLKVKEAIDEMGYRFKGEIHHHSAKGSDVWFS